MTKSVAHLAGNRVVIGAYSVQRCLICGHAIDEFNASRMASIDGLPPSEFSIGCWYEITEGNPRRIELVGETDSPTFASDLELPDNACIRTATKDTA